MNHKPFDAQSLAWTVYRPDGELDLRVGRTLDPRTGEPVLASDEQAYAVARALGLDVDPLGYVSQDEYERFKGTHRNSVALPAFLQKLRDDELFLDMATMASQAQQAYSAATGDYTHYAGDAEPAAMKPYYNPDFTVYEAELTRRVAAGEPYWCNAGTVARLSDAQLETAMARLEAERAHEDDPNALDAVADHWRDYRGEQLARQVRGTSAQAVAELDNAALLTLFEAHRDLALLDYNRCSEVRHHSLDWSDFLPDTYVHLDLEIARRDLAWSWFEVDQDNPTPVSETHELPF